ncbi:DNA-binding protein [Rhodococcus erythropolis]|jgi:excisionase family DNA binding protein|uniref:excisionase family DNA-binding protein n=1 Tax=Rhodococcus erythropolis TaxID=1833 RepID=UPI0012459DFA|nr:excisionase family DNA-binding protein [Rhodococcus erythropolis]QEX12130.1 DNA-binding protein [Rhodococcus erythropolis]
MGAPSPTATLSIADIREMDTLALTQTQGARAMGIDRRTVSAGIENGSIPSVKVGRRVLIPRLPFLALFGAND